MESNGPSPHPTIRRATAADAARLASVGRHLFAQTFGPANTAEDMHLYLESAFSTEKQGAELSDSNRVIWLVEDAAGSAVGYTVLLLGSRADGVIADRPAEIERIYVDATLHGAGMGHELMRTCVDQATAWGCDVIWLAVWEKNPRAIAFYEKCGFVRVGAKTFLLGTDPQRDWVMARKL
jgi:ribosomal protein S18 acetylase RimI-like enzyme